MVVFELEQPASPWNFGQDFGHHCEAGRDEAHPYRDVDATSEIFKGHSRL